MKRGCFISIYIILITSLCQAQRSTLPKELIGTWGFVQLSDQAGKKVDSILVSGNWSKVCGVTIILNSDGTYRKDVPEGRDEKGKWSYSPKEKSIIYQRHLDTSFAGDKILHQLIKLNDEQGNYYQVQKDSVVKYSNDALAIYSKEVVEFRQPAGSKVFKKML